MTEVFEVKGQGRGSDAQGNGEVTRRHATLGDQGAKNSQTHLVRQTGKNVCGLLDGQFHIDGPIVCNDEF